MLVAGVLAAVLAFGVYDQTTNAFVPGYAANARQWYATTSSWGRSEARLPHGASVFQLPYVPVSRGVPRNPTW